MHDNTLAKDYWNSHWQIKGVQLSHDTSMQVEYITGAPLYCSEDHLFSRRLTEEIHTYVMFKPKSGWMKWQVCTGSL